MRRTTYDKGKIRPLYAEDAPWCCITSDGRHGPQMVLASWEIPGVGSMCNYHAMVGWPELFIAKTIASPAESDADIT